LGVSERLERQRLGGSRYVKKGTPFAALHVKFIPRELKGRIARIATRKDKTLNDIFIEALEMYEEANRPKAKASPISPVAEPDCICDGTMGSADCPAHDDSKEWRHQKAVDADLTS
jgi:hypothetical protein